MDELTTRDVWEAEPNPWATFADALWIDNHERRLQALDAIIAWAGADPLLKIEARLEHLRLEDEAWAWNKDIEAREVAWHRAHPGDKWDRRAAA